MGVHDKDYPTDEAFYNAPHYKPDPGRELTPEEEDIFESAFDGKEPLCQEKKANAINGREPRAPTAESQTYTHEAIAIHVTLGFSATVRLKSFRIGNRSN